MLLARLGHGVVVVDQASLPSDTVSTHSIARSGVVQLRRWGLLDAVLDSGAPAIRQVTFNAAGESVRRQIKHKSGVDLLVAPRRYVLDTVVATAAERAGAQVRPGVTVTGVRRDRRGRVAGVYGHDRAGAPVELGARHVVGADGLGSRVAGLVGAAVNEARPAGGAAQYAYYAGIPWTGFEFFVAARSFAGVFPTHDGQACIWVCSPAADARAIRRGTRSRAEAFGELLERSAPQFAERLRQARRTSPVQGVLRQPNQLRQAFGPGWALVGDAGYYRDAVTACGISDAGSGAGRPAGPGRTPARDDRVTEHADTQRRPPRGSQELTSPSSAVTTQPTPKEHSKMTTTDTAAAGVDDSIRNGVDTAALFATLDAVKQAPEAAKFQFRAHNQWLGGTHNRSTIADFFGVGEERSHERSFVFDADHPAVLVGQDQGPTPVEFVLHALAACLTAGLANIAAARRVRLTEVRSTVTGDIDLNGILGLDPDVRNGYDQISVRFTVKGDAPAEKLREIVEQSQARSAVYDVITNQVPVTIEVDTP